MWVRLVRQENKNKPTMELKPNHFDQQGISVQILCVFAWTKLSMYHRHFNWSTPLSMVHVAMRQVRKVQRWLKGPTGWVTHKSAVRNHCKFEIEIVLFVYQRLEHTCRTLVSMFGIYCFKRQETYVQRYSLFSISISTRNIRLSLDTFLICLAFHSVSLFFYIYYGITLINCYELYVNSKV